MEKMLRDRKTILLMMLPVLVIYLFFIPIPALSSIFFSFTKWNLVGSIKMVGLKNYHFLFVDDYVFGTAIRNTLIFVGLSVLLQLPMAFFLANVLSRMGKGRNFFRNVFFLPVTFSGVAVSLMFYFIYHPNVGLLNQLINIFSQTKFDFSWLAEKQTALVAVIVSIAWQWTGYHMVIYLAGIAGIPRELWEVARIDGANEWQITRHVVFPLVLPVIEVSTVLITTSSFKAFDQIYIMTFGGPNHASEVLALHMYTKTFAQLKYGYGSTLSIVIMALCIVSTVLIRRSFKSGREAID